MQTSDVVRRVQRIFGDNNESQLYVTDIIDWINDAQMEIVRQTQCLQSTVIFDTVAPNEGGPFLLPSNFLFERRVTYKNATLTQTSLPELDNVNAGVDTQSGKGVDIPGYYYIWGDGIYLYPVPTAASQPLKVWYVNSPPTISVASEPLGIPVQYHEDIVRFALMRARELNEDYSGSDRLATEFQQRMGQSRDQAQNPYDSYPVIRDYTGDYWGMEEWL